MLAVLILAFATAPVMAADLRGGTVVTIGAGEVIEEDLYIGGQEIVIDGTVNGDVVAAGTEVTVNGIINGSVIVVAQTITINGHITRGAKLGANDITINGTIDRDLIAGGTTITITSNSVVGGDCIVGTGTLLADGEIKGDIKSAAGEASINNGVGGDVVLEVDSLHIASTASIGGSLTYTSKKEADIESGAEISGPIKHIVPEPQPGFWSGVGGKVVKKILAFLMIFLIGLLLIVIAPNKMNSLAEAIVIHPWQSLGWGALLFIATPIAIVIVMITVIGIPIGLITGAVYGIALYLAQIPVALMLGLLILKRSVVTESKGIMIGALAIGLVILHLLRLIPIAGFIIALLTIVFGLGSLVVSQVRLRAESRD
jgi:hypothetical protein